MSREQLLAWKSAWDKVNRFQIQELRAKSIEQKFRELECLFEACQVFGWTTKSVVETESVRSRWLKLHQTFGKQSKKSSPKKAAAAKALSKPSRKKPQSK